MADEFIRMFSDKAETPVETQLIKPVSAAPKLQNETVGDNLNSSRPFVNERLNSRLAQSLPVGDWAIRSSASLEVGTRPKHILHAFDRIIIQGDGPWQLFDKECKLLEQGYIYGSDVVLDVENKCFYLSDEIGMIKTYDLDNGNRLFSVSLVFGNSYKRSFIARQIDRLMVVSTEREMGRHSAEKPEDSTIEVLRFNESQEIDRDGILRSARGIARLKRKTLLLLSALYDETLVVATDNQICLLDFDLQIKTALSGKFTPLVISLSDAGIIYLVLIDNGVPKLRAIKPNGERIFSAELPEEMLNIFYPPIITYNHRVFLIKDNYLLAFAANGRGIWEYKSDSPIAGAVITAENQLLISDGSELVVFEANGRHRILYEFKNESLQTPPTITSNGELVVATDKKLYCLARRAN